MIWRRPDPQWIRENTVVFGDLRLPRRESRGNYAWIGVPGSGKTTTLIAFLRSLFSHIPASLDVMNGFVFDPKNDFYRVLLAMDLPLPVLLANVLDRRAWAWNMHLDIREPVDAAQFAHEVLQDDPQGGNNKFYSDSPRHRLASTLREFVRLGVPWTLRQAYLITMDDFYARQLYEHSADPQVRDSLRFMDRNARETWANISMSLVTNLNNLATYAALMDNVPPSRRYSLRKMIRNEAILVFGGDFKYGHVLGPMNTLILKILKNELVSQDNVDEPGSERREHWVIVDEFPKLNQQQQKPAESFEEFLEVGRSKGCRIGIALQTPSQLVRLYGREGADILLGLCQHKLIFRIGDYAGAEQFSQLLGRIHEYEWAASRSVSYTSGESPSTTREWGASEQFADRPVVHPDELLDLPLGDRERGLHFFGIAPTPGGTLRWRGHASPRFIAEHAADADTSVPPYERCRRPAADQYLRPLDPQEIRAFGLEFDPDGYRP